MAEVVEVLFALKWFWNNVVSMKVCKSCRRRCRNASFRRIQRWKSNICRLCEKGRAAEWYRWNKECVRVKKRNYYRANKERIREYARGYTKRHRDASRQSAKTYKENNREKIRAHAKVAYHVKVGQLVKPSVCENCGKHVSCSRELHAHHEDYSKPLEVNWLCVSCHGNRAVLQREAAIVKK